MTKLKWSISISSPVGRPDPPFPQYPEYMNGRLKKVDMEARLMKIKKGIDDRIWYPEWTDKELSLIHI